MLEIFLSFGVIIAIILIFFTYFGLKSKKNTKDVNASRYILKIVQNSMLINDSDDDVDELDEFMKYHKENEVIRYKIE